MACSLPFEPQTIGPPGRAAQELVVDMLVSDCLRLVHEASGSRGPQFVSGIPVPDPNDAISISGGTGAVAPYAGLAVLGEKIRVLIVEDEAIIAVVLSEILEEMGFDVCASEMTEIGAVAAALRHRPDLMIVDARLRQGSGIRAVATILRDHFVPHVFVSGDQLGAAGLHPRAVVLQKPFLEADLALAIQQALGPWPT